MPPKDNEMNITINEEEELDDVIEDAEYDESDEIETAELDTEYSDLDENLEGEEELDESEEEYDSEDEEETPVVYKETLNSLYNEGNCIVGDADEEDYDNLEVSFDAMVAKINEGGDDDFFSDKPIDAEDVLGYLNDTHDDTILSELGKDTEMSNEDIQAVIELANKMMTNQEVSVYKELPKSIKDQVDKYSLDCYKSTGCQANLNTIRNTVAKSLMDEFITNIKISRSKTDFATEMEKIYRDASKEISDVSLDYMEERNKVYREAAEKIEDEEKRNRLISILDQIDEARALTDLKEFAKRCKIKPIEIEKAPTRCYEIFLNKYKNSSNNIYSIYLARKTLIRNLCDQEHSLTSKEIDCFLICFCKQVLNYSVENPLEHAYMYYVMYNCALLDSDKSEQFRNNIIEVVNNSKERNSALFK